MKKIFNISIKASSMGYSIILCTLLSIVCYSLLLISSYQELHKTQLSNRYRILHTLKQTEHLNLRSFNTNLISNKTSDILENGVLSKASIFPWGGYHIISLKSWFKKDTLMSNIVVGQQLKTQTALYLTDRGKPLQISGKSKIIGTKFVPNGQLRPAYITGNSSPDLSKSIGKSSKSSSNLPDKRSFNNYIPDNSKKIDFNSLEYQSYIYESFSADIPLEITNTSTLDNITVEGFVIISATDSIFIRKTAQLTDVFITAPVVHIEKGFKGAIQIYATESVIINEDVQLTYPSSIVLNSKIEDPFIKIHKGAKVLGGVAMVNNDNSFISKGLIEIDPSSLVVGSLYCKGRLSLKGSIIGSVFTEQFYLKTTSGEYENYIDDGIINRTALPKTFLAPTILQQSTENDFWTKIKGV